MKKKHLTKNLIWFAADAGMREAMLKVFKLDMD
jgi:hypothetical protein